MKISEIWPFDPRRCCLRELGWLHWKGRRECGDSAPTVQVEVEEEVATAGVLGPSTCGCNYLGTNPMEVASIYSLPCSSLW